MSTARRSVRTQESTAKPQWMLVFGVLLALRITNALSIKTFFQPDEYFQSLEPAWNIAFGAERGAWITWEWREALRSALHPWIFAVVYRFADTMSTLEGASRASRAQNLIIAPKIAQAIFASVMDLFTWRLGQKVYGASSPAAMASLALTAFSPWQWYASTRTFANSFETMLTVVALDLWPWEWFIEAPVDNGLDMNVHDDGPSLELKDFLEGKQADSASRPSSSTSSQQSGNDSLSTPSQRVSLSKLRVALAAAAIACILRPTNIIIWFTIAGTTILRYSNTSRSTELAKGSVLVGSVILLGSAFVDREFYKTWTFPALRFLYLNVMQDIATFYGRNRVDYYFTEGLPLLLTTSLPFATLGMWKALQSGPDRPQFAGYTQRQILQTLAIAVTSTVVAFSMIAHKEMRFIYPLLPILHVVAAQPLANFFSPFPLPRSYWKLGILLLGLVVNVYIAAYVSIVHQRGVVDVMHYLRHEAEMDNGGVRNTAVGFLMPCHSTPWRSHFVHPEINAWALTCEPPVNVAREDRADYLDEADVFYMHPGGWLDTNVEDRTTVLASPKDRPAAKSDGNRRAWPEYLVFFEQLEPVMNAVLEDTKYRECWRGFNTHWHDDNRRRGDVIVQCLR